jgi:hypothetical protein
MRGSKPSLNPWRYSGLTRLLAQSNDVNELWEGVRNQLPYNVGEFYDSVAWSLPSSVGCIRSPAGEYWVILTPQNLGIYGFKLTAHPITPTLLKIAEDTALSATIREIADSWILALCSTKNAEVVELVSATDSQYINAHLDFEHISYWGFQWRYQHRGAPDEHLCGAIGRNSRSFTPTFTDLITKLDFSWVEEQEEEILTCSIISNSSGLDPTQKIRYHTWYDSEGNINYLDAIFAWDNFYSIARVAAFSFNDGELLCGVPGWVEEDYYSYLAIHGDPPVGTTYNAVSYFVSIYRGESPNSFWIINGGDPVDCVVPTWRIYEARFMDIGRGELLFDGWDLIDYGCVTLDQGNLYVNEILSDMDQETFDAFMQQYLDALNNPTEEIPGPISNGFLRTILFPTNVSYAKNSFIWNSPYPFPVSPLGRWVGAA